ncbi:ATP-dependent helicase [Allohahella marinimesophila]|uniref:DNA 3'-5' helicase n=1 Tax=Allohahella marinimesophila TaxID=1054972 RepID=A0ABP7PIH1_9GAMM
MPDLNKPTRTETVADTMQLTAEQRAIIQAPVTHVAITAVAGSGKTTTLAHRILHLLDNELSAQRILVLMFNRAAKLEFEKKLRKLAMGSDKPGQPLPEIRTYHAMGLRLYKRFIEEGYLEPFNPKILSEGEIQFQLWRLIREVAPEDLRSTLNRDKKEHIEKAEAILDISKAQLTDFELTFEQLDIQPKFSFLKDVAQLFEDWRQRESRISFADMLYEPVKCLQAHEPLRRLVRDKMDVVLVDEYQDTNEVQHQLLKYIAGSRARVTIVGDPDQTIYEFRGASTDFILKRFQEDFEDPAPFQLTWSFRYGHRAALAANHLIGHNKQRRDILCRAHQSTPSTTVEVLNSPDEAHAIARLLQQLAPASAAAGATTPVAILCRLWSQAVPIELALLANRMPYRIDENKGALNNREVRQVLNLLRATAANWSALPFETRSEIMLEVLRFPHVAVRDDILRGLTRSLARIDPAAPAQLEQIGLTKLTCKAQYGISSWQLSRIEGTLAALRAATLSSGSAATVLSQYITQTDLLSQLGASALTTEAADEKVNNVLGLYYYIKVLNLPVMDTLQHFDELRTEAGLGNGQRSGSDHRPAIVELTTIHKTKGLEWPTVVVAGFKDSVLPYRRSGQGAEAAGKPTDMEAERRLVYVGITRAKDSLYLSAPAPDSGTGAISPFIAEMDLEASLAAADVLESAAGEPAPKITTAVVERYFGLLNSEAVETGSSDASASRPRPSLLSRVISPLHR